MPHLRIDARTPRLLTVLATTALCLGTLSACGENEAVAQAEKEGAIVGDAVRSESEESGYDITTAIAENPWQGDTDAFVSGTYDFLVVNTEDGGCAKLVFEGDEAGSDYTIEKTYEC